MVDDKPLSPIEQAKAAAERLEKANIEAQTTLAKAEDLRALDILGGRGDKAGPLPVKPVISPKEYAEAALKGQILKDE